jgi:hypothetical protein
MVEDPETSRATIGDVFCVVNEMRRTQEEMRRTQEEMRTQSTEFRASVEERLDDVARRLGGQTESALNVALHVLGEQRGKLRELIDWVNSQGARIEKLP